MFQSISKFISYWWFRYLLVTELYMVEKWERVVIHVFFFMVFAGLSYFNSGVFLNFIEYLIKRVHELTVNPCQMNIAHSILDKSSQANILSEL